MILSYFIIVSVFKVVSSFSFPFLPNVFSLKMSENQRISIFRWREKEISRRNGLSSFQANASLRFYTFFVPAARGFIEYSYEFEKKQPFNARF